MSAGRGRRRCCMIQTTVSFGLNKTLIFQSPHRFHIACVRVGAGHVEGVGDILFTARALFPPFPAVADRVPIVLSFSLSPSIAFEAEGALLLCQDTATASNISSESNISGLSRYTTSAEQFKFYISYSPADFFGDSVDEVGSLMVRDMSWIVEYSWGFTVEGIYGSGRTWRHGRMFSIMHIFPDFPGRTQKTFCKDRLW